MLKRHISTFGLCKKHTVVTTAGRANLQHRMVFPSWVQNFFGNQIFGYRIFSSVFWESNLTLGLLFTGTVYPNQPSAVEEWFLCTREYRAAEEENGFYALANTGLCRGRNAPRKTDNHSAPPHRPTHGPPDLQGPHKTCESVI